MRFVRYLLAITKGLHHTFLKNPTPPPPPLSLGCNKQSVPNKVCEIK